MTIISLFNSQEQAGRAIDELSKEPFTNTNIEVIDSVDASVPTMPVLSPNTAATSLQSSPPVGAPVPPQPELFSGLSLSQEEEAFLTKSIRGGGVVLVIDPKDAPVSEVQHVLQRLNGRML